VLRYWLITGTAVATIALALGGGIQWIERPVSYHDAVIEALEQRQIAYSALEVREICLPDPDCVIGTGTRTFSMVVISIGTIAHDSAASTGQITCYDRRGDCSLDLPALGIYRAPLRDLRSVWRLPKPLARMWEFATAWLRGWLRPTPGS
jgi:hypothetical protein